MTWIVRDEPNMMTDEPLTNLHEMFTETRGNGDPKCISITLKGDTRAAVNILRGFEKRGVIKLLPPATHRDLKEDRLFDVTKTQTSSKIVVVGDEYTRTICERLLGNRNLDSTSEDEAWVMVAGETTKNEDVEDGWVECSNRGSGVAQPILHCAVCGKTSGGDIVIKKCGKCLNALYCGRDCQRADYKTHQKYCNESASRV